MEASALLAAVVTSTDDAVIATDADGVVTYWGGAAPRIYGWTAEEAIGQPIARTVPPHRAGEDRMLLDRLLAGERVSRYRTERLHRDGSLRWVSLTLTPVLDEGRAVGGVAVVRDLGGAESEELAAELLDSAPDAMVVADAEGTLVLANQQAHTLFGYPPGTLVGLRIDDLVPTRLRARHRSHRRGYGEAPVMRPMGTGAQELVAVRADGSELPVEISLSPLSSWRGPLVSAAIRDATDRREAEAALRNALALEQEATAQLRAVDRLKDEFLATVSHELRTPLSAIGGFAELLVEHAEALGAGRKEDLLRRIAVNAAEMQTMVEQLLDYSRLTAGRVAFDPQDIPLEQAVEEVLRAHEGILGEHRVRVAVEPGITVHVDRVGFGRVVGNFLTNAAKFSPAGSTIAVRAGTAAGDVRVSVTDEGVGIAPEHLDTVFERFFQVGQLTVRGAGIGLSIASRYAELHGGRLEVESTPGRGSTFTFVLPAVSPARP